MLVSCDNILPLPTKNRANTFGCKINGDVLKTTKFNLLKDSPIYGKVSDSSFNVSGQDNDSKLTVSLRINKITEKGSFIIDGSTNSATIINSRFPTKYYQTKNQYKGMVQIKKFDVINKCVAGTFSFEAVRLDNSVFPNKIDTTDVIKVTKGRFDVDFKKLK